MALTKYKQKRDFTATPEPLATIKNTKAGLSFVVQRHKASRLHYDFRLELNGVLKSWAVPKGPSMNPQDKRLAMMVEDHPYDYKDFKGVIPSGYGAGIVEIWDNGRYTGLDETDDKPTTEKKLVAALKAGNLKFRLYGKKLKGEFALVKLKGKDDNAWLLIKHRDEFAVDEPYNSEEKTPANSPINKWLLKNKAPEKKKPVANTPLQKTKKAALLKPMLAKETDKPFDSKEWLFEIKWDGYRAIAAIENKQVELYSRNGNSFNSTYAIIVQELSKINYPVVFDGEIVVLNEKGKSDFQKLQMYSTNPAVPLYYYVFDILSYKGKSMLDTPLIKRKELLKKLLQGKNGLVRYSDHLLEKGIRFFATAQKNDLEGIMAKKIESHYYPGQRTSEWLKIKHHKTEDVIIVGYTQPDGSRKYFGALVLAIDTENGLQYAGHTGSGFNEKSLKELYDTLQPLITEQSPFKEKVKTNMPVTWVEPKLICEVKFTEWTNGHNMRHPIFMRLRDDKTIDDMRISLKKSKPVAKGTASNKEEELSFGKTKFNVTHPDKIFWPDQKITKKMLIDYYQSMAEYILPYLKDRPESLKRNPNGINDNGFFHKDAGIGAPSWVKTKTIYSESAKKDIEYIVCNDKATLAYLNNLGCIELNPWNSTVKALDKPDYMIIDIDPSEKNTFGQVILAALAFKKVLDKAGAACYCKTSGATGLHIYVPFGKKYSYEQAKKFAELLCTIVHDELPGFTSMDRNLQKRGNNKIYLDYLQNRRGQTIAAPYSVRPRDKATVSTPLDWKEVRKGLDPTDFAMDTILKRVKKTGDLFKAVLGAGIDLNKCISKLS